MATPVEAETLAPETRTKVFISYSRADKAFAADLVLGLAACGFAPYIDRHDIAGGEDWKLRLAGLIAEADTVVYVISPDSLTSEMCGWELAQSLQLSKRVLPVVWRPIDDGAAPEDLRRLNYIFFSGDGRTFAAGLADLAQALRTDIGWIREHTRLGALAQRWEARNRSDALLLRGDELDAAAAWSGAKPMAAPPITDAQADFIKASSDARTEAQRRAQRARAGLLTAVSAVAVALAILSGAALWQWSRAADSERLAQAATREALQANDGLRSANLRLGAEVWLRTAPSDTGYYVIDQGWYPVAANYSGAIARVTRSGGDKPTTISTGFIIDGGLVHPRYAGEPLLLMPAGAIVDRVSDRPIRLGGPPPRPPQPSALADTLDVDAERQAKLLLQPGAPVVAAETTPDISPPADTLPDIAPTQPQTMIPSAEILGGPAQVAVSFPALDAAGAAGEIEGKELVWETPAHAGGEFPFQIWRLSAPPPFGWRAISEDDVACADLSNWSERTIAMLGLAVPAEGGPSPRALALNISELLDTQVVQNLLYTHSTNRASGGAPVFDLATGDVFAIHIGSEPDPDRRGRRRGFGYGLTHLINVARSQVADPSLGPLCDS